MYMMAKNLPSDTSYGNVQILASFTMNNNSSAPLKVSHLSYTHTLNPMLFTLNPRNELVKKVLRHLERGCRKEKD